MGTLRISKAGSLGLPWVLAGSLGLCAVLGCTVAVGAGVGAAMLGGAALTAGCYDPIDVTVVDGVTGLRACDARVVARSTDGAEAAFASCFHAELPVGTWTVSADRLGYQPVSAALVVSRGRSCEPAVQTLEITLLPLGVPSAPAVAIRPPRPGEAPLTPGALPAPASMGVEQAAPVAPLPAPVAPPVSSSTAAPVSAAPTATSPAPAPPAAGSASPAAPPAGSSAPSPPSGSF